MDLAEDRTEGDGAVRVKIRHQRQIAPAGSVAKSFDEGERVVASHGARQRNIIAHPDFRPSLRADFAAIRRIVLHG